MADTSTGSKQRLYYGDADGMYDLMAYAQGGVSYNWAQDNDNEIFLGQTTPEVQAYRVVTSVTLNLIYSTTAEKVDSLFASDPWLFHMDGDIGLLMPLQPVGLQFRMSASRRRLLLSQTIPLRDAGIFSPAVRLKRFGTDAAATDIVTPVLTATGYGAFTVNLDDSDAYAVVLKAGASETAKWQLQDDGGTAQATDRDISVGVTRLTGLPTPNGDFQLKAGVTTLTGETDIAVLYNAQEIKVGK